MRGSAGTRAPIFARGNHGHPFLAHDGLLVDPAMGDERGASLLEADGFLHFCAMLTRKRSIGELGFNTTVQVVDGDYHLCALAPTGARFAKVAQPSRYVMSEHDHRERASEVDSTSLWTSYAERAVQGEARWRSRGTLTPTGAATLARIQGGVARHVAATGVRRSKAAIARAHLARAACLDRLS